MAIGASRIAAIRLPARSAFRVEHLVMILVGGVVSVALVVPLAVVAWRSFQIEQGLLGFAYSLDNYARIASPRTLSALKNSFIIGGGSALLAGFFGVSLAWIVARTNTPWRRALETWNIVPFFMSTLLGATAWAYLASPTSGLLNKAAMGALGLAQAPLNINSYAGVIWVSGLFHAPFVYLFCIGALRQMDPALEHAARISGSSGMGTVFRITLPLAMPAILSSLLLAFVLGFEDLGTPITLGYPHGIQTISTEIFDGTQRYPPNYNYGAALGCVLVVITGAAVLLQRRITARRSFVTVTGRGYRPQVVDLGRAKYLALALNLVYVLSAVVLPIGALAAVSFSRAWLGFIDPTQFSVQHYLYLVTTNPMAPRALRNSLLLAVGGATIGMAFAVVIAYAIHRTRSWTRGWLDVLTSVPIGVPGMVFAIGLLVALIRTPVYGTLWIILLAYMIRFFPYGQRSVSALFLSLSHELDESSRTSGAGWLTTMWRVLLPLLRPGLVAGWLLLFITFMREVSMSLLLSRSGTETLSSALLSLITYDPVGASAAFTLVQVILILLAAVVFLKVAGRESIRL